jgi:hypothetical protein
MVGLRILIPKHERMPPDPVLKLVQIPIQNLPFNMSFLDQKLHIMSRPGIVSRSPWWEANTLETSLSNSLLIIIWNIYI